jgi:DNA-directed RNA polymerase specialized sigma24 family protein
MHAEGLAYREIGRKLGLSKNTVMAMVRRVPAEGPENHSNQGPAEL